MILLLLLLFCHFAVQKETFATLILNLIKSCVILHYRLRNNEILFNGNVLENYKRNKMKYRNCHIARSTQLYSIVCLRTRS